MPCTGDCCVCFPISKPLSEIGPDTEDGPDLLAMLVELTPDEATERRARFGVARELDDGRTYFRCVHWDEATRRCGNYSNRPGMCRYYPYGRGCEHGCDCADGRAAE